MKKSKQRLFHLNNNIAGVAAEEESPIPLDNLYLWLKTDAGVYTDTAMTTPAADGQTVGGWADQSGNDRHMTQNTAGNRPEYNTNQINGLPLFAFLANKTLRFASSHNLNLATAYCIVKETGGGSTILSKEGEAKNYIGIGTTTDFSVNAGSLVSLNPTANGDWYFYAVQTDGTNIRSFYEDQVSGDVANANNWIFDSIGFYNSNGIFVGNLAEIIVYDAVHDGATMTTIKTYLRTKYGL